MVTSRPRTRPGGSGEPLDTTKIGPAVGASRRAVKEREGIGAALHRLRGILAAHVEVHATHDHHDRPYPDPR
jgi:hypothetical protein